MKSLLVGAIAAVLSLGACVDGGGVGPPLPASSSTSATGGAGGGEGDHQGGMTGQGGSGDAVGAGGHGGAGGAATPEAKKVRVVTANVSFSISAKVKADLRSTARWPTSC